MKSLHAFALLIISAASATAQTNTFPASGNVGIGTASPGVPLQVVGSVLFDNGGSGNFIVRGGQVTPTNLAYLSNNYVTKFYTRRDANYGLAIFDQVNAVGLQSADLVNGNSPQNIIFNPYGGNVGIGVTNPGLATHILGAYGLPATSGNRQTGVLRLQGANSNGVLDFSVSGGSGAALQVTNQIDLTQSYSLLLNPNGGNVGVGITNPVTKFEVNGALRSTDEAGLPASGKGIEISYQTSSDRGRIIAYDRSGATYKPLNFESSAYLFQIGNVGIGTNNPTEKLSVNGRIRAKEVIVDTNWSDYVFAKDYKLASLAEVEQHIQQQGHLPGVPSAAEVAEKGVSVGDMQAVLLAKVEELTLHVIAQEKELARLREREKEIATLRAEVQQLRQAK